MSLGEEARERALVTRRGGSKVKRDRQTESLHGEYCASSEAQSTTGSCSYSTRYGVPWSLEQGPLDTCMGPGSITSQWTVQPVVASRRPRRADGRTDDSPGSDDLAMPH